MRSRLTIMFFFLLGMGSIFAQWQPDTIKYNFKIQIPDGNGGFINTKVSEGCTLEGKGFVLPPTTLPALGKRYQPLYDAIVGSVFGFEKETVDSTAELNITLKNLDPSSNQYSLVFGQKIFLFLEIAVRYKGQTYSPLQSFHFKTDTSAYIKIPVSASFLSFVNATGLDPKLLGFAYVIAQGFDPSGIRAKTIPGSPDTTMVQLAHFSKFGGGGKSLSSVESEKFISRKAGFSLDQNYPNPFNPSTKIIYTIPENGFVSLKIYSPTGAEIETLVSEEKRAGTYELGFNASKLPSGVYFYSVRYGNSVLTRKMLLIK